MSHAPQWSGLLDGLTQAPAQQRRPVPHAASHPPPPELPPLAEPLLDVLPELPLPEPLEALPPPEDVEPEDEELADPLELAEPPLDEDAVPPSPPEVSVEASVDAPEENVEPPQPAAMMPTARTAADGEHACFIE